VDPGARRRPHSPAAGAEGDIGLIPKPKVDSRRVRDYTDAAVARLAKEHYGSIVEAVLAHRRN
jgi:hypothetical protein